MSVDPQIQVIMEKLAELPKMASLSAPQSRDLALQMVRARAVDPVPVGSVEERTIPGPHGEIPVRVYTPEDVAAPMPLLVLKVVFGVAIRWALQQGVYGSYRWQCLRNGAGCPF